MSSATDNITKLLDDTEQHLAAILASARKQAAATPTTANIKAAEAAEQALRSHRDRNTAALAASAAGEKAGQTGERSLHDESRADLIALYEDRIAAKDFKTAISIKIALAKLVDKTEPEPEPIPESFSTQQAVVRYLVEQGWKANDSTLSLHVQQRKLLPGPDGTFALEDVDSYAIANLVNNPQRSEKNTSDELVLEAKQLENRRLRMKVEQQEGLLVNSEDVKRELENMLVSFRSRILLIPRKLSSQLSQMNDPHKVEEVLTRELRDTLSTLSQYHIEPGEVVE